MAESAKSLHAQNALWIAGYVALNVIVFVSLVTQGTLDLLTINETMSHVLSAEGATAAGAFVASTILNGLLRGDTKAVFVFWRLRHSLPGHRAFSLLGPRDPRVDMAALKTQIGTLPTAATDQNLVWYKLYRRHRDEQPVMEAHRRYLLTRDITVLTLLFLLALPGALYFAGADGNLVVMYGGTLFLGYLVTSISAQRYGTALVTNVLAAVSDEAGRV
jgi:hypothetical protein